MNRDLGMRRSEVHLRAREILDFWLVETPPERRFVKDAALDREIAGRFGALRAEVKADNASAWRNEPDMLLAAIILFDQFSRNIFRGEAEAFATDPLARELTRLALTREWDRGMTVVERQFLYMPLMHSEDIDDQALCVQLFEGMGDPLLLDFAVRHAAQIERYGRFPQRNLALGRQSTPEEAEMLSRPGETF
ncbi:DUF924 family protein [Sphingomonas sp. C3-2]|uniref:DUF924 family protein n=1 Tax=Sphingomonas sp. C3-2 TaxID=3062169 RepID=UPI00294B59D7|nr:DUF924 family protein [Sphingomonas sp. C3-2]WOK37032.1 DUF924 family protein [Sphingomonas sp. C3-2]